MSTKLERLYPGHKIRGVYEFHVELSPSRSIWYYTLIDRETEVFRFARQGKDDYGRKILVMALTLEDEDGFQKVVDFKPEEIVS